MTDYERGVWYALSRASAGEGGGATRRSHGVALLGSAALPATRRPALAGVQVVERNGEEPDGPGGGAEAPRRGVGPDARHEGGIQTPEHEGRHLRLHNGLDGGGNRPRPACRATAHEIVDGAGDLIGLGVAAIAHETGVFGGGGLGQVEARGGRHGVLLSALAGRRGWRPSCRRP